MPRIFNPALGGRLYGSSVPARPGGAVQRGAGRPAGHPPDPMRTSYTLAATLLREKYQVAQPAKLAVWNGLQPHQLVVVDGRYDHMHRVLEAANMAHTRVTPYEVTPDLLAAAEAVFVNCPGDFPTENGGYLPPFVKQGGLMLATDWAVKHTLEGIQGFQGFVRHNGQKTHGHEFVPVELIGTDDPLTRGFFEHTEQPGWWLEPTSYPIQRLSRQVEVLATSQQLRARYGNGSVIVRFPLGEGGVYVMISHFWLQQARALSAGAEAKTSVDFATSMGATRATTVLYEQAQEVDPSVNFAATQAAATSMSIVTGILLDHLGKKSKGGTGPTDPK